MYYRQYTLILLKYTVIYSTVFFSSSVYSVTFIPVRAAVSFSNTYLNNLSCHYAFALDPKVESSALAHNSPMYKVQTVSPELNMQYLLVPCVPSPTSHDVLLFPCSPHLHFSNFLKQHCLAKCAPYVRKCCDIEPRTLSWPYCRLYFR